MPLFAGVDPQAMANDAATGAVVRRTHHGDSEVDRNPRPWREVARPENAYQSQVLRLLRDEGPRSRADLADVLRLSRSKLAAEIDRLAAQGLVEPAASHRGRKTVRLSSGLRFVGIDIGATSIDVAVTGGDLEILGHRAQRYDARRGARAVLETALEMLGKLRSEGVAAEIHGAGIGLPGPVSFRDGKVASTPNMPGWDAFPVREVMSQELGCPVLVDNDVNVMMLGEQAVGLGRSLDNFLLVKLGTRIGCGVVIDGSVYRGMSGGAGDIGHIRVDDSGPVCACGETGCLEAYFGGAALARDATLAARADTSPYLAARLATAGELTAADVSDAVAAGDAAAMRMVREGGRYVGRVLTGVVSFVNPGMVIIAGGVSNLGHPLLAEIRDVVYRRSLPLATRNLTIMASELGSTAGVIGGARLISDRVFSAGWRPAPGPSWRRCHEHQQ